MLVTTSGRRAAQGRPPAWNKPIWETDLDGGLRILRLGIDTHLITAHALLPLVVAAPGGLLIEVTDGTRDYNADHYRISVFYDLVKAAVNRLAWSFGHELGPQGATAVAVTPGWLRSEMMLEAFGATEDRWREADAPEGFAQSESPRFVGRGIAADPERTVEPAVRHAADLAAEYGSPIVRHPTRRVGRDPWRSGHPLAPRSRSSPPPCQRRPR